MTEVQTETVPEAAGPGRTRWGVMAAILVVPALVVAGLLALLVAWLFTDDSVDTGIQKAPCAQVLAYGGAKLPTGAYDGSCRRWSGPKFRYEATFRMPRAGVRDWLTATFPDGPQPRSRQCGSETIDLCLTVGAGEVPSRDSATQVEITYDGPKWAQVRFLGYTP